MLSLDADETLSNELRLALSKWKLESRNQIDGYKINRLNFYCGKAIKTCLYPDSKIRLWSRGTGEWKSLNPHDKFELYEGKDAIATMPGDTWG